MEVVLALLADAANRSQEGKLNILGAFSNVSADTFPARHPQMQLVLGLEASPAEVGMQKKLEIKIMDEDGEKISGFSADFEVPKAGTPGERTKMQLFLGLRDTVFPKQGRYVFSILIDGKEEKTVPLTVGG